MPGPTAQRRALRGRLALARGAFGEAVEEASAALRGRPRWSAEVLEAQAEALAIRALAFAALDRAIEANRDAARVLTLPFAGARAVGGARLAELVVLARHAPANDRRALVSHLAAHGQVILATASPRERRLVHALARLAEEDTSRGIYRAAANAPTRTTVRDWGANLVPSAAAYMNPEEATAGRVRLRESASEGAARERRTSLASQLVVLLAFLTAAPEFARPMTFAIGALIASGVFAAGLCLPLRYRRRAGSLAAASRDAAEGRGDRARTRFREIATSNAPAETRARAELGLAVLAQDQGSLSRALDHCDRALELARSRARGARDVHGVEANALAEKAVVLAAMGHGAKAAGALAKLKMKDASRAQLTLRRVDFLEALASRNARAALDVLSAIPADLPCPLREAILAELVRAQTDARTLSPLTHAMLRGDAGLRAYVGAVAPDLLGCDAPTALHEQLRVADTAGPVQRDASELELDEPDEGNVLAFTGAARLR